MIIQKSETGTGAEIFTVIQVEDLAKYKGKGFEGGPYYGKNGGNRFDTIDHFRLCPDATAQGIDALGEAIRLLSEHIKWLENERQDLAAAGFAAGRILSKGRADKIIGGGE